MACPAMTDAQTWSLGVLGGIGSGGVMHSYHNMKEKKYLESFAGIFIERNHVSWFGLRAEFQRVKKGADVFNDTTMIQRRLTVYEMSLMMVLRKSNAYLGFEPSLSLGVKPGYITRARYYEAYKGFVEYTQGLSDVRRWELGAEFGASLDYGFYTNWSLHVGYRFSLGLIDIDRDEPRWLSRDYKWMLGLKFDL